ncbi:protein-(glutamine-N5) methyltransferase, release factor-specific [Rubidibacter lacunae KORDI 51-2]|uniref:Release factor glutamine methyltransferase n=1 Tax=Rubidibacter lacunae KORDI 51-2 TaxID=582515 RepID=U5DMD3_9CHRO|nr:peptide chain release factor N(5)-glutamine methyltransferase [Rubidibacter lacunae]ERN40870.1 protein-(glutamine-N5) methyltransferase, release factor-specific [Rubidibacter lacunae KORDI 51-2]
MDRLPAVSGSDLACWRTRARQQAMAAGIDPTEVDWLLREGAGLDTLTLRLGTFASRPQVLLERPLAELDRLWQRRVSERVPVQYLIGQTPWRDFTLHVSPAVLIPRPETEELVELAIATTCGRPDLARGHWADLGTGSGAIAIALAAALPSATIHATDIEADALKVARANASTAGVGDRVRFYCGSWYEPLAHLRGRLSGCVSNPPYIPSHEIDCLQPEVARHEPRRALDGGVDGLDCVRHAIATAPSYLHAGGVWLCELMAGQAPTVLQLLVANGSYNDTRSAYDLAGIERVVLATRR